MDRVKTDPIYHLEGINRRRDKRTVEEKKADIVMIVEDYWNTHGYAPSLRDVMSIGHFLSLSSTRGWVEQLIEEGRIEQNGAPTRNLLPAN
jgi:SOS-response transcriptional repressor LexA